MVVSEVYPYSQQNGILRSLFNKNPNYYNVDISIFLLYEYNGMKKEFAFNFDQSNYWVERNISFCFKKGSAFITKYEIQTTTGSCRPSIWSFAGSNDNRHWKYIEEQSYEMKSDEIVSKEWNHGVFRCYQLRGIKNQCTTTGRIDVKQIEIFGTYFPNGFPKKCTLKIRECSRMNLFFVMIILTT